MLFVTQHQLSIIVKHEHKFGACAVTGYCSFKTAWFNRVLNESNNV